MVEGGNLNEKEMFCNVNGGSNCCNVADWPAYWCLAGIFDRLSESSAIYYNTCRNAEQSFI